MNRNEFLDQFDVIYNNISSNQAPGLDEYEISVFCTKAQNEILLSYLNPMKNKLMSGYDGSPKRQIDFSKLTVIDRLKPHIFADKILDFDSNITNYQIVVKFDDNTTTIFDILNGSNVGDTFQLDTTNTVIVNRVLGSTDNIVIISPINTNEVENDYNIFVNWGDLEIPALSQTVYATVQRKIDTRFDKRSIQFEALDQDKILWILNESVTCDGKPLTVVALLYPQYDLEMQKPYKYPPRNKVWRLVVSDNEGNTYYELISPDADKITDYTVRYVKKPKPIMLKDFTNMNLTIEGYKGSVAEGYSDDNCCEVPEILHSDILQRAAELAKAAYTGDLNTMIATGNASATELGIVPQQNDKQ